MGISDNYRLVYFFIALYDHWSYNVCIKIRKLLQKMESVKFSIFDKTPRTIKQARLQAGHTQIQAAELVHSKHFETWNRWEAGTREMPTSTWELYLIKTNLLSQSVP